MQSLSPECTPLKHRYDTCFNLWFEGYLQPALDGIRPASYYSNSAPTSSSTSSTSTPQAQAPTPTRAHPPQKKPLITSWANAFPSSIRRPVPAHPASHHHQSSATHDGAQTPDDYSDIVYEDVEIEEIDTTGKTRAQIKAEEYDRACGQAWKDYQGCLKKAIKGNESLSTLLEQAREEHPLKSMDKLEGTAWDPKTNPADIASNE